MIPTHAATHSKLTVAKRANTADNAGHVPIRTCVGCRIKKPKGELLRIVKQRNGTITLDNCAAAPGRGAYICPDSKCAQLAHKRRALDRSFRQKVADEVYERLLQHLSHEEATE